MNSSKNHNHLTHSIPKQKTPPKQYLAGYLENTINPRQYEVHPIMHYLSIIIQASKPASHRRKKRDQLLGGTASTLSIPSLPDWSFTLSLVCPRRFSYLQSFSILSSLCLLTQWCRMLGVAGIGLSQFFRVFHT